MKTRIAFGLTLLITVLAFMLWPSEDPKRYYEYVAEFGFRGEPVRIRGVIACRYGSVAPSGLGSGSVPTSGTDTNHLTHRLADGSGLYLFFPKMCNELASDDPLPQPGPLHRPYLLWRENPEIGRFLEVFLPLAYFGDGPREIDFKQVTLKRSDKRAYDAYQKEREADPKRIASFYNHDAFHAHLDTLGLLEGIDENRMRFTRWDCSLGKRIPKQTWSEFPEIVDWVKTAPKKYDYIQVDGQEDYGQSELENKVFQRLSQLVERGNINPRRPDRQLRLSLIDPFQGPMYYLDPDTHYYVNPDMRLSIEPYPDYKGRIYYQTFRIDREQGSLTTVGASPDKLECVLRYANREDLYMYAHTRLPNMFKRGLYMAFVFDVRRNEFLYINGNAPQPIG
ncbi:MAG: hypothetical protein AAGJ09_10330 [Pseudomonadota bacterium]